MNKKGISEIVTAILIILLVLGAVVIVWQVVRGTVEEAAVQVESKTECIGLSLSIEDVKKGTGEYNIDITVKRGADSIETKATNNLKVSATCDGDSVPILENIQTLGTSKVTVTCTSTSPRIASTVVQTGLILDDGTICEGESGTFDL